MLRANYLNNRLFMCDRNFRMKLKCSMREALLGTQLKILYNANIY